MSVLVLVRHGQARSFEADSDQLSELGRAQARLFGEHLAHADVLPDEVYSGTLERQRQTAELVGSVVRQAGRPWPERREDPRWNEYDSGGVLARVLPRFAEQDAAFWSLLDAFQREAGGPERNRYFQRMFEVLMEAWQSGCADHPEVESFAAFYRRVASALDAVTAEGGARRVMVFTSGGPIGVSVQRAVGGPPAGALRVTWRVKNTSTTEYVFSKGRLSLDSFNLVAHLGPELHSFR